MSDEFQEIPLEGGVDYQLLAEMKKKQTPKAMAMLQEELSRQEMGDPHSALVEPTDLPLNADAAGGKKRNIAMKVKDTSFQEIPLATSDSPPADTSFQEVPLTPPSTMLEHLEQGGRNMLGSAANLAGEVAQGLGAQNIVNSLYPGQENTFTTAGRDVQKGLEESVLTKEQQANASIPQAIASGIGGGFVAIPLTIAASAVGGTAAAMTAGAGLFGGTTYLDVKRSLMDQNVDEKTATGAAAIQGAGAAVFGMIPGAPGGLAAKATAGALTNVTQGIVTDAIVQQMFPERPEIQEQFNPWSEKNLAVNAATGAVFPAGHHLVTKGTGGVTSKITKHYVDKFNEHASDIYGERVLPALDNLMGPERPKIDHKDLETLVNHGKVTEYTDEQGNHVVDMKPANATEVLEGIIDQKDVNPHQKATAELFRSMADQLGLHEVPVTGEVEGTKSGEYVTRREDDQGNVIKEDEVGATRNPKRPSDEHYVRVLLHEIGHSINSKAFKVWEKAARDPKTGKYSEDPAFNSLMERVEKFNTVFQNGREKALEKLGFVGEESKHFTKEEVRAAYFEAFEKETEGRVWTPTDREKAWHTYWDKHRGWANMDEFAQELGTNHFFAHELMAMDFKKDDIPFMKDSSPRTLRNQYDASFQQMKSMWGMPATDSFYDLAMHQLFGVYDVMTPEMRGMRSEKHAQDMKKRREDVLNHSEPLVEDVVRKMGNTMRLSSSKDMMVTRLNAMSTNPTWRRWVAQNTERLWNNKQQVIGSVKEYKKGTTAEEKYTGDPRNLDEWMHDEFSEYVQNGKILKTLQQWQDFKGLGRQVNNPTVLSVIKDGIGASAVRFMNNKARDYKSLAEIIYSDATSHFKGFNDLPYKEKLKLQDTIASGDSPVMSQTLKKSGLQWMTDDMIRQHGHSEEAVKAYRELTKGVEFLWNLTNQALIHQGKAPIEMIPGFMPHIWKGAYKVFVTFKEHQKFDSQGKPQGTPKEYTVSVRGYQWKQQAAGYAKRLAEGQYDSPEGTFRAEVDPQTRLPYKVLKHKDLSNSIMITLQEHVTAFKNGMILNPETLQILENIEADNNRGFSKHTLERSGVKGFVGEEGTQHGWREKAGLGSKRNNEILKLWQNYARTTVDFYKNTLWQDEVSGPMTQVQPLTINGKTHYAMMFEELPTLRKHQHEFSSNFTGENVNHLKFVDDAVQDISQMIGYDPLAYRHLTRAARNILSLTKLRANVGNIVANVIQPAHAVAQLDMMNAMLINAGRDPKTLPSSAVSVTKAIAKRFVHDKETTMALEFARSQGHLKAQLDNELGAKELSPVMDVINTATGGKVNMGVESFSRQTTFLIAWEHMRKVFPNDVTKARNAAIAVMEMTMVNYDHSSRPLMYQNFGVVGEALSPFAVFRNAYMGNVMMMMRVAYQGKNLASMKPLITSQLVYLATAGAMGMLAVSEYNIIVNQLNKWFPGWDLPTAEEMFYKWGVKDIYTTGAVSEVTKYVPGWEHGAYLGGSMNAVGTDDAFSAAIAPFLTALGTAVGLTGQEALSMITDKVPEPSAKSYYQAGKQLVPKILQGRYEKLFMAPGSQVAPKTSTLEGGYEREQSDWNALNFGMGRSLTEVKESTINRINAKKEQGDKEYIKTLVDLAVDKSMGIYHKTSMDEIRTNAAKQGIGPDKFNKMVVDGKMSRILSERYKSATSRTLEGQKLQRERDEMR